MSMTQAQISAAVGGDVFILDYPHADVAQTFTFDSTGWGPYKASGLSVGQVVQPNFDSTGTSQPGTFTVSVTLFHIPVYNSARIEWDGTGFAVAYSIDGGTTWTTITQPTTVPVDHADDPDLDVRITFAGGVVGDTAALNSITVYALTAGTIRSTSGARTLTFGTDPINVAGLVSNGETISAAAAPVALEEGTAVGGPVLEVAVIEMMAAISALNSTLFGGVGISVATNVSGGIVASGCTVYVNGIVSTSAPALTPGSTPYHFVIVPTTPVNEQFTIAPGLTLSNLAVYVNTMSATDANDLYESSVNGLPTIVIDDASSITVTETASPLDIYAYAWSVVSGGTQ